MAPTTEKRALTPSHRALLEQLHGAVGADCAMPLNLIAHMLGISTRRVQTLKHDLILAGYPIGSTTVSGSAGIFMIADNRDLRIARNQILNRVRSQVELLQTYDKSAWVRELLGQLELLTEMEAA